MEANNETEQLEEKTLLMTDYLTLPQVSELSGIPLPSVYFYHQRGQLKTQKILGVLVTSQGDFDAFMADYRTAQRFKKAAAQ